MKTYNIIDLHPYRQALVIDGDFADYLREHSWDIDDVLWLDNVAEFWELLDQYMKEESK